MEGVASEVSLKIRSAIKAKLVELGTYVDEELPDYIMVLVANKKTKDQMDDDLSLFLGHNTERFTSWLHHVLQKLNAAALLQGGAAATDAGRNKVTTAQEDAKKKELEEEKRREKEEEKKREREEEKKRAKTEEAKKLKEEEKRKAAKDKDKVERKRKSSERKNEKKDKKLRKSESPPAPEKVKERRPTSEVTKLAKPKETVKEKEKLKPTPAGREEPASTEKPTIPAAAESAPAEPSVEVSVRKIKPLVRGKISSADIFRAESQAEQKKEEEEEELEEDLLVLRADADDLGLELEDEPAPRRSKQDRAITLKPEGREDGRPEQKVTLKMEGRDKAEHREKIDHRDKADLRDKAKGKADPPAPRISAKERLGGIVPPKANTSREKPSVLDRLGSSTGGKHIISLREESAASARSDSSTSGYSQGVARAVSSAITSAHRSVCVLPPSNSSGKKLEARVRPLMSRQVESSHGGGSRGVSEASSEDRVREGASRLSSGRVVSAVGAVLKRPHTQSDSDEEEEYDPKKPGLSGVASKVEVTPRPRRPRAIQANTALILRAMADAHKSVNRPSQRSREREKPEKQKSRKKHKGELFSRSYREREEASRQKVAPEPHLNTQEAVRIRKIAITVPNATHKEVEKQVKQEKEKVKEEEEEDDDDDEDEVEVQVAVAMRQELPEEPMETSKKEPEDEALEVDEDKAQVSDNDYGMEEVEEVEEEVVDEGIEEDQPPVQQPLPPPVLASRENTKFIVTLEGVDSEEFPEKVEPALSIRSRLGARPTPADTEDQVEEYIEEVEEWEEEEEMSEEMDVSTGLPVGGAATGVKARLKAAATPALSTQPGGSKERCKYWPLCKAGEACIYHHPTVTCKSFPACKFGDKCLFIHPNCLYDGACTRIGCPYTHASSRNFAMVSAAAAAQKHKVVAPTRTSQVKCKFFPKCTNLSCPFLHPKACYYGAACKTPNCSFTHPAVPMGAKLKWVAPKPATTQAATPTTTAAGDSKEVGKKEETLVNK